MVCPAIAVDNPFEIPPTIFKLPLADESDVIMITPPCAHSGPGPVTARLISYECRLGQVRAMFPLISWALNGKKFPCAVFMNFGGNLGAQNFFAYRDFKKANNYILFMFKQNGVTIFYY